MKTGVAGGIARAFLRSKLTPLLLGASLLAGAGAVITTPREEEPQISVPMVDVFSAFPGAGPEEVDRRITEPLERRLWEIPGVEHLYSRSDPDGAMTTVRFRVGDDPETSVVKVFAKLAGQPVLVKLHTIDEVPILTLTFWGDRYDGYLLRQFGAELRNELKRLPDIAQVDLIGGDPRVVEVLPDPARLAANGITLAQAAQALEGGNAVLPAGSFLDGNRSVEVRAGRFLERREDVEQLLIGVAGGRAVRLGDVATVTDGPGEPVWYVSHLSRESGSAAPAVTLAIAKRPGVNASQLSDRILEQIEALRGHLVPRDLQMTVTRNYGETASEKAGELLSHIIVATVGVALLVWLALGWREALVVLVAVPVTLALTLLVYRVLGYTLNRITLFALVFAIGILVDDAIVVVENIARHLALRKESPEDAAVSGVDEVGNPTILATFTVIAAILPMAFVSGLMGPYMRPIPVGASMAMLFSLAVAFIVTPYLAFRLVRHADAGHADAGPGTSRLGNAYAGLLRRLLGRPRERVAFYAVVVLLLMGSVGLVLGRAVTVKMLPFDNKSEFQVVLDFPAGTTLETSARGAQEIAERLLRDPDVRDIQVYAGTAAPFNFNGLVRHYFLRQGPAVADLQVNLRPRTERHAQSHAIAVRLRPLVTDIARRYGASAKVAEIPPGPPVLATLTAEIYGPDVPARLAAAQQVRRVFDSLPGVVDVDWSLAANHGELRLTARTESDAAVGISAGDLARSVAAAGGVSAGWLHDPRAADEVPIRLRLAAEDRSALALRGLRLPTPGGLVPASVLAAFREDSAPQPIYRKDLRPVVYVTGDVAGELESPAYAMMAMERPLSKAGIATTWSGPAPLTESTSLNWDGEWRITYEVFRDLGIAFAAVLGLIYVLVVAWFQSFRTPLIIMAPIPLTLAGILPAHWATGAFFTATSMIGMIALAGIIVRNSILLVDFVELARERGASVREAVVEAGLVRARPILLTAIAVVVGGAVMVQDPIFQGLGISMIAGALVATLLTLVTIPLLYAEFS